MGNEILKIDNLSISIKHNVILKNISFSINEGDFIFLKGKNGSGKTTLFNVLTQNIVDYPYNISGTINYYGKKISDIQLYKRNICFIPQIHYDYGDRVKDRFFAIMNVLDDKISEIDLILFLKEYNVHNIFNIKYEKLLIRKYASLSQGQQKFIDILCGIMRSQKMKILFIDEPLNHLDTSNIKIVIDMIMNLRQLNPSLAIVLTTHCQAFPHPTKFFYIDDCELKISSIPYVHYNCFD